MAHSTNMPQLRTDPEGRIDQDLSCIACDYNLRGLPPDGTCPECGRQVQDSLSAYRLCFADPAWLRRIARGLGWLIWSMAASAACSLALDKGIRIIVPPLTAADSLIPMTRMCIAAVLAVIVLFGWWQVTWPEPLHHSQRPWTSWRQVARISYLIALALLWGNQTVVTIWWSEDQWQMSNAVWEITNIGTCIFTFLAVIALFTYLRRLALRMPNRLLARRTLVVMLCCAAALLIQMAPRLFCVFGYGSRGLDVIRVGVVKHASDSWSMWIGSNYPTLELTALCLSFAVGASALILAAGYRRRLLAVAEQAGESINWTTASRS